MGNCHLFKAYHQNEHVYQLCFVFGSPLNCRRPWWYYTGCFGFLEITRRLELRVCRVAVAYPAPTRQTEPDESQLTCTNRLFWSGSVAKTATGRCCCSHLHEFYCCLLTVGWRKKIPAKSSHFIGFCEGSFSSQQQCCLFRATTVFFWILKSNRVLLTLLTAQVKTALMFLAWSFFFHECWILTQTDSQVTRSTSTLKQ